MIQLRPLTLLLLAAAGSAEAPRDPASALCVRNGAVVTSETLPNGSVKHVCVFPGGTRIDAAAYFRNTHRTR